MSKFASRLLTAACVLMPTTSINPDTLIDHISEEANRLAAQCKHDGGTSGKGKHSQSQDEAMVATQGDGRKKHQKGKCQPDWLVLRLCHVLVHRWLVLA